MISLSFYWGYGEPWWTIWWLKPSIAKWLLLHLPSDFRHIFRLWTKFYFEMWKKYTHLMVHAVSTSLTPRARHDCVWAEDSKAYHQIPLSVQKVVVEGCQGELQPAPNTCLLWDGNSRDHSSKSRQLIITTAITTSLAYKIWNDLIGISLKPPFSATSFHNSN